MENKMWGENRVNPVSHLHILAHNWGVYSTYLRKEKDAIIPFSVHLAYHFKQILRSLICLKH